ncbi:transposase [Pseudaminobacter sp. 19-2017]|uniref:Transposase n=1 Tax=Pseudaminobacter soli (ex Zhang et al. 2022) TaxID=2831468 RepID=A0A942I4W5_9HYPH|nr:transposase [Pseudaminobacter soli]MBS3652563.1 transposase [Pseudaminobacter soli]
MADDELAESETTKEARAKVETPEVQKQTKRAKSPSGPPRRKKSSDLISATQANGARQRQHSEAERAQKISQIEEAISGGATLKDASKQAGISTQTYYHWKKAAPPAANGDELKDLLALEQENKRLKTLLAERLRKENAELRRKLGMD